MNSSKNNFHIVLVILLVAVTVTGYFFWQKRAEERRVIELANTPMQVEVINTPNVGTSLPAPGGFPEELIVDEAVIIESNTTRYPIQNAVQTSVVYESSERAEDLYKEFADYLMNAGYEVVEGASGELKSLSGKKTGSNLNIVITTASTTTKVTVAHLSFEN